MKLRLMLCAGVLAMHTGAALASANAHAPKGAIEDGGRHYQIYTNDQASKPEQTQR